MADELYRKLQQRLDTYSVGFPKTESGIEIRILKSLLSERDAKMFLALSPKLETAASVASRLDVPAEDVADHLEDMAERGLLFRVRRDDTTKFGAIPFVHGIFEFQVKSMDHEFASNAAVRIDFCRFRVRHDNCIHLAAFQTGFTPCTFFLIHCG